MATLEPIDGEVQCSDCDMIFDITWHRNPIYERVEFCPFCGEEIEGPNGE